MLIEQRSHASDDDEQISPEKIEGRKTSEANESLDKSKDLSLNKITVNERDLVPEESRVGKKLNELT